MPGKAIGYKTTARFLMSWRNMKFSPTHLRIKDMDIVPVKKLCKEIESALTGFNMEVQFRWESKNILM